MSCQASRITPDRVTTDRVTTDRVLGDRFLPDRRAVIAGGLAAGAALLPLPAFSQVNAGTVNLRLLETTDVHVHVFSYDYYRDQPDDTVGLGRIATLIDRARLEARNTLLFDNGDFLQGNPMGDLVAFEKGLKAGDVHPIIRAMNALKIDAGTLGNHEFNYGLDFLGKALGGAEFPVVCANLYKGAPGANPRLDQTLVKPYLVIDRDVMDEAGQQHTLRIGVIGFVPPQIMQWDQTHLAGKVDTRDIVETAQAWVPELREQCDLVVALAHSGISVARPQGRDENAAFHLSRVPGIDVIMTGHSHLLFPGPGFANLDGVDAARGTLNGVPAVMAGFWGSHLGVIDLTLRKDGQRFRVVANAVMVQPIFKREQGRVIPLVEVKAPVTAAVQADHEATLTYVRRPVGRTATRLDTWFALVGDTAAMQAISDAQLWYARPLLEGTEHERLPLLSAVAPFKAGGRAGVDFYTHVPAGEVALKNVADLYIYPNTLKAVKVAGRQLRDWLERSAGQFNQLRATDAEQPLINAGFPTFNFDMIDGVTYRIDLAQPSKFDGQGKLIDPAARRIVDLARQGRPVADDDLFVVVTNNYRAGGGGNFPGNDGTTIVLDAPDATRDVIIKFFLQAGTLEPKVDANWSFVPVPGAVNVVFESSPRGREVLGETKAVTFVGEGQNGFARYRLAISA